MKLSRRNLNNDATKRGKLREGPPKVSKYAAKIRPGLPPLKEGLATLANYFNGKGHDQ